MSPTVANLDARRADQTRDAEASAQEYAFMRVVAGLSHRQAAARIGRSPDTCSRYKRRLLNEPELLADALSVYWTSARALREVIARFTNLPDEDDGDVELPLTKGA